MKLCVLMLFVLLLALGMTKDYEMSVVQAEEISKKNDRDEPVDYDHAIITNDKDLSQLKVVHADEIRKNIKQGLPIDYDNVTITNDQNLSQLKVVRADEIRKKIEQGLPVDYDHVIILGDLKLGDLNLPTSHVNRAYNQMTYFGLSETVNVLESSINITESMIQGTVDFRNSILKKDIDFSFTNIIEYVDFTGSHFDKDAHFQGSGFSSNANFGASLFNGIADFRESQFNGNTDFRESQFNEDADFDLSQFSGIADFGDSLFNGRAGFGISRFNEDATFLSQFNGDAYFEYSHFGDKASFSHSKFSKNSDFVVTWYDIKDHLICDDHVYQVLIRTLKSQGLFDEADDCYYQRMEQLPVRSSSDLFLRSLYWATCGYGVRPWRILGLSAILIVLFGTLYWIGGGIKKSNNQEPSLKTANHSSPKDTLKNLSLDYVKKVLAGFCSLLSASWYILRQPRVSARSIFKRLNLLLSTPSCISVGDAIFFSTLVFFVALPPPAWSFRGPWRAIVVLEDILGWMLMTLFVVTLSNVMIR
jgi:hypothetical protein